MFDPDKLNEFRVEGTVFLIDEDGNQVNHKFAINEDVRYQQWDADAAQLAKTVPLMESLSDALGSAVIELGE